MCNKRIIINVIIIMVKYRRKPFARRKYVRRKSKYPKRSRLTRLKPEIKSQFHLQTIQQIDQNAETTGNIKLIMPTISQGVGENQRIGNRCKGLTLRVAGILSQKFVTTVAGGIGSTRIGVRIIVCQSRRFPNAANAYSNLSAWLPYIINMGNTGAPLLGVADTFYAPLNKEVVKVWSDKHYFMTNSYVPTTLPSTADTAPAYNSTKFFKYLFNLKNKTLLFETGTVSTPANMAPMMIVSWCPLDGTALVGTPDVLRMSYRSDVYFTDT